MSIYTGRRAETVLAEAWNASAKAERPLAIRLSASLYYFVSAKTAATKKQRTTTRTSGTYLGWPGMSQRVEVQSLDEAKEFQSAFTTFAELLFTLGPRAVVERLKAIQEETT